MDGLAVVEEHPTEAPAVVLLHEAVEALELGARSAPHVSGLTDARRDDHAITLPDVASHAAISDSTTAAPSIVATGLETAFPIIFTRSSFESSTYLPRLFFRRALSS